MWGWRDDINEESLRKKKEERRQRYAWLGILNVLISLWSVKKGKENNNNKKNRKVFIFGHSTM